jgi:hypothetical protein
MDHHNLDANAAPPYFTTMQRPAKRWMKGRASLRTETRRLSA